MAEAPTSRTKVGTLDAPPAAKRDSRQIGHRYRCAACYEEGRTRTPVVICHHCGRALCMECAPRDHGPLGALLHHQELEAMRGRGQAAPLLGHPSLEAAHCEYCHHPVPRLIPWFLMGGLLSFLLIALLWGLDAEPALLIGLPLLLFTLWGAAGFTWRLLDSLRARHLFFPIESVPILEFVEEVVADGVLDGFYKEEIRPGMPRGKLVARIPLDTSMIKEVDHFAHQHNLKNEADLAALPASAGSIILERTHKILRPSPAWPEHGVRRWELSAPLAQWPLLWEGKGPEEKALEYRYEIDWLIPRLPFTFPCPVQVFAHFPQRSDRRTLELGFAIPSWLPKLGPQVKEIVLQRGDGLPAFKLLQTPGRPLTPQAPGEQRIADVPFDTDFVASVRLQFEEDLPQDEPAWLSGIAQVRFAKNFSGLELVAFYDAYGVQDEHFVTDWTTLATLHFEVNVVSVPYQGTSMEDDTLVLETTSVERDDAILRALGEAGRLIQIHESSFTPLSDLRRALPPSRDVMGHWPMWGEEGLSPAVFHVNIHPMEEGTQVRIQVEAPVSDTKYIPLRAKEIVARLREIVEQADRTVAGGRGSASRGGGGGSSLHSRLKKEGDE